MKIGTHVIIQDEGSWMNNIVAVVTEMQDDVAWVRFEYTRPGGQPGEYKIGLTADEYIVHPMQELIDHILGDFCKDSGYSFETAICYLVDRIREEKHWLKPTVNDLGINNDKERAQVYVTEILRLRAI